MRLIEESGQVHACRWNFHFPFEKAHGFAQVLNGDDLQTSDDRGFGRVVLRNQQANFAFGFGAGRSAAPL